MLEPLHDLIVVKKLPSNKSSGGIELPHGNQAERTEQGEVMAVGKGRRLADGSVIPLAVAVGDHVLFDKGVGRTIDGGLHVLHEADIFGVYR